MIEAVSRGQESVDRGFEEAGRGPRDREEA